MLTGILPAARGVPQIEVIFEVNLNGLLTVTAHDKDGQQSITVTADKSELTQTDIVRMANEEEALSKNAQEARARSAALDELQQTIAVKRSCLNNSLIRGQGSIIHAELDNQSHWAESSGSLASLEEINCRVKQVDGMSIDPKAVVVTHEVNITTTVDPETSETSTTSTTSTTPTSSASSASSTTLTAIAAILLPGSVGWEAEATPQEQTEAPEVTACANVPPPDALALRKDL
ncbi:ATPase with role in protein import into the ER [Ceratobasidium sp. 428]|nr:ATPase with role in protein import into the ER [Ceratobasidium sp. 428]